MVYFDLLSAAKVSSSNYLPLRFKYKLIGSHFCFPLVDTICIIVRNAYYNIFWH